MRKNRMISMALACVFLLCTMSVTAYAQPAGSDVDAKQALVEKYSDNNIPGYEETEEYQRQQAAMQEIFDAKASKELTDSEAQEALAALGIYALETEHTPGIVPYSSPGDISLSIPEIYYNSNANTWVVTANGRWRNSAYMSDSALGGFWAWPKVGNLQGIGGLDGFGIRLYACSGESPTLKESKLIYGNGMGIEKVNYNRESFDSGEGAFFQFRDALRVERVVNLFQAEISYIGLTFSVVLTYDTDFANYHGKAVSQYVHTWDFTNITGIGLGAESFSVEFDKQSSRFICHSTGEVKF